MSKTYRRTERDEVVKERLPRHRAKTRKTKKQELEGIIIDELTNPLSEVHTSLPVRKV